MSTRQNADAVFFKAFGNDRNFMTPNIERRGWVASGRHAYEISWGYGMDRNTKIYGVTIVDADGTRNHELSECAHSLGEAEAKLEEIRERYR